MNTLSKIGFSALGTALVITLSTSGAAQPAQPAPAPAVAAPVADARQTSTFDELLEKAKVKSPARALVDVDDVGMACAFLAHDAARLMTGQVLYIDGGYNIID